MSNDQQYHEFRKIIETEGNAMYPFALNSIDLSEYARDAFTKLMRERLANKPDLADFLIPDFAPGCRRLTPGPGSLEVLGEDNVNVISKSIRQIVPEGAILEDGELVLLDVLVSASGFDAMGAPVYPVVGSTGTNFEGEIQRLSRGLLGPVCRRFLKSLPHAGCEFGSWIWESHTDHRAPG